MRASDELRVHCVTAGEIANIISAACEGQTVTRPGFRYFRLIVLRSGTSASATQFRRREAVSEGV